MSYSYINDRQGQYFPIIPLALSVQGSEKINTLDLIDSGATVSVFKMERGKEIFLGGVGGRIKGYIHELDVRVAEKNLKLPVVFSHEYFVSFNLLGRTSFFDQFKITFDEKKKIVELI